MPVSDILSALADENRRRILTTLKQGRVSSGELAQAVGMTPQACLLYTSDAADD